MKLKKLFIILLVAIVSVGCGNDTAKEDAKKQKALEQAQEDDLYTEVMGPGFSQGSYGTKFEYDRNFKSIRKLVVKDFKKLNDEQDAIEEMYSEFNGEMGTNGAFLKEAPDFTNLKQKATAILTRIEQAKVDANAYVETKAIKARAEASKMGSKYKKIYIELMLDDSGIGSRATSMISKIDELMQYTKLSKRALDFLTAHQTEWINNNGTVSFYNKEAYQEYNNIVDSLSK